jgi:hypothetical protein
MDHNISPWTDVMVKHRMNRATFLQNIHQSNKISQITDTFKTKVLKPSEDNSVHHVIFYHYICPSGGSSVFHPVFYHYICPRGDNTVHPINLYI